MICLLVGRAYQAFFFDLPLRTFFWDEYLLKGIIESITSDTWQAYVTNTSFPTDSFIISVQRTFGIIWLMSALCITLPLHTKPITSLLIWCSSFLLLLIALLYSKERFWQFGQFFEYAIQVCSPILLIHVVHKKYIDQSIIRLCNFIIAITFVSHGLYAIGYYTQPDYWLQWCKETFMFGNDRQASYFLIVMGIFDMMAAIGLFFDRTKKVSLMYCIAWGFMTAMARVLCNFYMDAPLSSMLNWWHETAFRLLHGGLPLFVYLQLPKTSKL